MCCSVAVPGPSSRVASSCQACGKGSFWQRYIDFNGRRHVQESILPHVVCFLLAMQSCWWGQAGDLLFLAYILRPYNAWRGVDMPHLCRWHAGCFKCGFCQKLIGQGTVWTEPSHPGIPYCSNVCLAAVHNPCTVCGKPLTGMVGVLAFCILCDILSRNMHRLMECGRPFCRGVCLATVERSPQSEGAPDCQSNTTMHACQCLVELHARINPSASQHTLHTCACVVCCISQGRLVNSFLQPADVWCCAAWRAQPVQGGALLHEPQGGRHPAVLLLPAPGSQVRPVLAPCAHESAFAALPSAEPQRQGLLAGMTGGPGCMTGGPGCGSAKERWHVCSDPSYV